MSDQQEILELLNQYIHAIHTQAPEDFLPIWADCCTPCLISIGKRFDGLESIYQDFCLGSIRAKYSFIELVAESTTVQFISEDTAILVFRYHTNCTLRSDGSYYSIAGIETQVYLRTTNGWRLAHIQYGKDNG